MSDELCVACATTRDNRYVIIHKRGTVQEKQTLISDAGGAIFTGWCSSAFIIKIIIIYLLLFCNVTIVTFWVYGLIKMAHKLFIECKNRF